MKNIFDLQYITYIILEKKILKVIFIFIVTFTIQASAQFIIVTSPNGGEALVSGSNHNITWTTDLISNIKIEYSLNYGLTWEVITSSFPAFTESYLWTIPDVNSEQVIIKIQDVTDSSINDLSNSQFLIGGFTFLNANNNSPQQTNGTLTLNSPIPTSDGGIVWIAGTIENITWTSDVTQVNILYSINGGNNWDTIVINYDATLGTYPWSVPTNIQPTTQALIKIEDSGDSETSSQNVFFIFISNPQFSIGTKIKILPLGDSITHGRSGGALDIDAGANAGYELELWNSLRGDNINFDFTGNKYSGYDVFPDYENAGFPGYSTSQVYNILTIGKRDINNNNDIFAPGNYLTSFPSDVVLLHIGTNDFGSGNTATVAGIVEDMLDHIHNNNSDTWVVLAKILRKVSGGTDISSFNDILESIARTKINLDYKILIVDMYDALDDVDYTDGTHPNTTGYDKMATIWYNALKLILPDGSPSAPAFSQSTVDISANVGIPLNYNVFATGTGTPSYAITAGAPSGMQINSYTGQITWTPTSISDESITVQATNGSGSDNQTINIHVYEASNKPSSLIAHLKFNENLPSGPFRDEININNAYITKASTSDTLNVVQGRIERAVTFNGSFDTEAYIPQSDEFNFGYQSTSASFTVEAWIKPSNVSTKQVIVGQYDGEGRTIWSLGINNSARPYFQIRMPGFSETSVISDLSVQTNNWFHIVGVKNGSSSIHVYVNGTEENSSSQNDLEGFKCLRPIDIGHLQNNLYYSGVIDEISIYNSALDDLAIQSHYNTGVYSIQGNVIAFLQGPYNSGAMNTNLRTLAEFPEDQPYSGSPWNYLGLEDVPSVPADVVDWVLLELRTGTAFSTMVTKRSAFIMSDGSIKDIDGTSPVNFYGVLPGNYYIVLRHRNHLAVMSADTVSLPNPGVYDFTTGSGQFFGGSTGAVNIQGSGDWGMIAGDASSDGTINAVDFNDHWLIQNGTPYDYSKKSDFNMNATINAIDFNSYWIINNGKATQVPN